MSITMTLSMASTTGSLTSCSNCGLNLEELSTMLAEAQRRISDLEAQVTLLNQKCTSAVDRLADYEDEILLLKAQNMNAPAPRTEPIQTQTHTRTSIAASQIMSEPARPDSYQSRLSIFLSTRKSLSSILPSSSSSTPTSTPPSTSPIPDLQALYDSEVALRKKAELALGSANEKLDNSSAELEELSTQLFIQANEMVATERKARAKLEERSGRLEERVKVLEGRDEGKRRRLEALEGAVVRIERVRGLLSGA